MPETIGGVVPVPGKSTVTVHVGEASYEIASGAALALDLRPGLLVTPHLLDDIEQAARRREAAAVALRYLRGRPRTVHEVSSHLRQRGHGPAVVSAVLEELQKGGLVDDARYAELFVDVSLRRRPSGAGNLIRKLLERGVEKSVAIQAARRGVDAVGEADLALRAAQSRLAAAQRLGRERGLRRMASFLASRGFTGETVRSVSLQLMDFRGPGTGPRRLEP
jgi:regulatory protein